MSIFNDDFDSVTEEVAASLPELPCMCKDNLTIDRMCPKHGWRDGDDKASLQRGS